MLKGISDTNTEEQILRSIDVLKEVVLSTRKDVKNVNQRFDRVESDIEAVRKEIKEVRTDVNQRFDRIESDIGEIRKEIKEVRTDVNQRFDRVESDIGEIKETLREMNGRNL